MRLLLLFAVLLSGSSAQAYVFHCEVTGAAAGGERLDLEDHPKQTVLYVKDCDQIGFDEHDNLNIQKVWFVEELQTHALIVGTQLVGKQVSVITDSPPVAPAGIHYLIDVDYIGPVLR